MQTFNDLEQIRLSAVPYTLTLCTTFTRNLFGMSRNSKVSSNGRPERTTFGAGWSPMEEDMHVRMLALPQTLSSSILVLETRSPSDQNGHTQKILFPSVRDGCRLLPRGFTANVAVVSLVGVRE